MNYMNSLQDSISNATSAMFADARLKLTILYAVIILTITGILSGLFYLRTVVVLEREYQRLEDRMTVETRGQGVNKPQMLQRITHEDLETAKHLIAVQLLIINGGIVLIFSIAGYFLSGITLRPIEEAHEAQRQFVGDAAHELRTPLTALKTSLEVNLLEPKITARMKSILTENLEGVQDLEQLTARLLRLAQLDDQALQFERVKISKTFDKALKSVKPMADQKQVKIEKIFNKSDNNIRIMADAMALTEAWVILLDNAVKYSRPKGLVKLEMRANRRWIEVRVSDAGKGISQQDLPHIFDRFYRVDESRSQSGKTGYGLGLSVARKIVTEHGGQIWVKSNLGKGTTFGVQLQMCS